MGKPSAAPPSQPPAPERAHRLQITLALISLVGVLGAALLANWDRVFGRTAAAADASKPPAAPGVSTQGAQSPVVSGVGGNVTINIVAASAAPAATPPAEAVNGRWVSDELQNPYAANERYRLELRLTLQGHQLLGEVIHRKTAPETRTSSNLIVRGLVDGTTLTFDTRSASGHTEHYQGQIEAGELRLTRSNDVPSGGAIEAIVMRRP